MHARRVLGWLFLAVAALLSICQIGAILSMQPHPMLPDFTRDFLIRSSIENFGFAFSAGVVGFSMFRGRARFWSWLALVVAADGLWLFVGRELWLHYVVLPRMSSNYLATHSYFDGPLWWLLIRSSWQIMLPIMFILAAILTFKVPPAVAREATPGPPA